MRKLATIQKIADVQPIEGADKICKYKVNGWWVVDQVEKYHVGDKVIYCEVDSYLPIKPEFEFLRKSSYKKMSDGTEGFRLKTIKLRGQISQGLILPYSTILGENSYYPMLEGEDVSHKLGIVKYEPPIPACLSGQVKGNFPAFLNKTDEERIQNLLGVYSIWKNNTFYVTEKLDGSSMTCYIKDGEFGVCSRNMDLAETEGNAFWQAARSAKIEERLRAKGYDNICIQGELLAPGVQGNKYKVSKPELRVFNVFDIMTGDYYSKDDMKDFCWKMELNTVPILDEDFSLPNSVEDLLSYAEGKSQLADVEREGVVVRTDGKKISFKVISNKFLLKNED